MARRTRKASVTYRSEAELCDHLVGIVREQGFKVYAETGDFDLLLVAGSDCRGFKEGDQIGVQAKLRANLKLLSQSLPRAPKEPGPHYYAVLVPAATKDFRRVVRQLDITLIQGIDMSSPGWTFSRLLWHRVPVRTPCWVPMVEVPKLQGGVKSPRTLSPWKVKAVLLCVRGARQGYLMAEDFRDADVSMTIWKKKEWIKLAGAVCERGRWKNLWELNADNRPPYIVNGELRAKLEELLDLEAP